MNVRSTPSVQYSRATSSQTRVPADGKSFKAVVVGGYHNLIQKLEPHLLKSYGISILKHYEMERLPNTFIHVPKNAELVILLADLGRVHGRSAQEAAGKAGIPFVSVTQHRTTWESRFAVLGFPTPPPWRRASEEPPTPPEEALDEPQEPEGPPAAPEAPPPAPAPLPVPKNTYGHFTSALRAYVGRPAGRVRFPGPPSRGALSASPARPVPRQDALRPLAALAARTQLAADRRRSQRHLRRVHRRGCRGQVALVTSKAS